MDRRVIAAGAAVAGLLLGIVLIWLLLSRGDGGWVGKEDRISPGMEKGAGGEVEPRSGAAEVDRGEARPGDEEAGGARAGAGLPAGGAPAVGPGGVAVAAGGSASAAGEAGTPEKRARDAERERLMAVRCTLSGIVRVDGAPRSGIALTLASWYAPQWTQSAVTTAGGAYSFSGVRLGPWSLSTTQPRLFGKGAKVECEEDGQALSADLDLSAADVHVLGRVTDVDGNPLDRTKVEIEQQVSHQALNEMIIPPVAPDGRFEVWLPRDARDWSATAEAPGHLGEAREIPTDRDQVEVSFRLKRESVIHGLVLGPEGPRAGCEVLLTHANPGGSVTSTGTETEADGRFSLPTGPGKAELSAWDREVGWAYLALPAREEAGDVDGVVLRLQPGKTITGVIRLRSGKPVPLGRVHFNTEPTPITALLQADMQGAFTLPNLPPRDEVHLQAWDDARPWKERGIVLPPDQTQAVVILVPARDGQEAP